MNVLSEFYCCVNEFYVRGDTTTFGTDISSYLRMAGSYIIFHGFFSLLDISVGIEIYIE